MKDLWFRFLVLWFRLLGSTAVQAEWRARRALNRPAEAKDALQEHARRSADERFNCVCGQLLVVGDKTCHACGRRQFMPHWLRKAMRALGLGVPSATAGTMLAGISMLLGYLAQVRYGEGSFVSPSPHGLELLELGASFSWLTVGPQPWRGVTYTMLHGNLMHIAFNAIVLTQIGPLIERRFGTGRFLFGWVLSGLLAVLLPPLIGFQRDGPVVGASGAVFGLIGMAMLRGHLDRTSVGIYIRDTMIKWTLYTTVFGLLIGSVAHDAHFAGLAAGALVGWLFPPVDGVAGRKRLSPVLGLAGGGIALWALISFALWTRAGAPPPEGLPPQWQMAWYQGLLDARGPEAVFEAEGKAVLAQARQLHDDPGAETDIPAFAERLSRVLATLDPARRALFVNSLPQTGTRAYVMAVNRVLTGPDLLPVDKGVTPP